MTRVIPLLINLIISMKIFFIAIGALVLLMIGFIMWSDTTRPSREKSPSPDVISTGGLHWHSTLAIYVRGEKQDIPPNIGIGATHRPMHTHTEDAGQGIIHMEFPAMVRKSDLRLDEFFVAWSKDMRSFGANMKMTVNGTENTEYENYMMGDGDKIELRYE